MLCVIYIAYLQAAPLKYAQPLELLINLLLCLLCDHNKIIEITYRFIINVHYKK